MMSLRKTPEPGSTPCFSILLVEDDPVVELNIQRECNPIFKNDEFGADMVHKKTCDAGWDLIETRSFDIYVIDWHTPGQKMGPELIEEILRRNANARVIFYTSSEESEINGTGLRGRVEVIRKDPKLLRGVLEKWLRELKEKLFQRKNSANANKE